MLLVIQIVVCVILVIFVGTWLSQSADILAEKTGLGRSWVGAILLAGATSLPELAVGISAVVVFNAPDLAAGGIFGSCLFNLFILALLDIFTGPSPLLQRAQISHALAAGLGSILLGVAAAGILLAQSNNNLIFGWVGSPSIVLIVLYLVSARIIARFELRRRTEVLEREVVQYEHIKRQQAFLIFATLSVAIVVLGVWLASLGDRVATVTGLGQSFIGALLLAATTSLPEVVAGLAAIRLNAVDLAVSNVFGSNIFNMAILGVYDLAYFRGNLWSNVSSVHIFTAVVAMMMTSVAIVGLIYRAARPSRLYITWDGLALILLYISGMYIIYRS
ncbi:sodium:calcium antiporter [Chlorogloeopsis fritschii PCC 9212]|uniref:Sodium/calcium exchanger membrane protein n=1 Tax=Chlorogloeopsis fritschii PCC 6912 TaxID=211165 RepID=A0A433NPK3_CHLFR|nr:cation transporter [Chlorogloeopsis fritschii]RUR85726.1 sodium/calcium exchanger membrane protein [Chlorogloeopsis fritschii PCC 6912]